MLPDVDEIVPYQTASSKRVGEGCTTCSFLREGVRHAQAQSFQDFREALWNTKGPGQDRCVKMSTGVQNTGQFFSYVLKRRGAGQARFKRNRTAARAGAGMPVKGGEISGVYPLVIRGTLMVHCAADPACKALMLCYGALQSKGDMVGIVMNSLTAAARLPREIC